MSYLHGRYAYFGQDQITQVDLFDAGVVYVGAAPINTVKGFSADSINKVVTINNMQEAINLLGYSEDWEQYPLCEAMHVHFGNASGNIGPVHFINVLDPSIHIADDDETGTLTFVQKKATITDSKMIVDSFELTGKTEGVDYSLDYDMNRGILTVMDISSAGITSNAYTYNKIEMTDAQMASAVIGTKDSTTGAVTGLKVLKSVYQETDVVPTLVLAPKTSSIPAVETALAEATKSINGRFTAQYYVDIPLVNAESVAVQTVDEAINWADTNNYNNPWSKAFYPMVKAGNRKYHISTLFAAQKMITDMNNAGIPFETASNKVINIDSLYFGATAVNQGIDIEDGNKLNSNGITTAIRWNGNWRLWGGHTSAFSEEQKATLGKEIFDTYGAMQIYLANDFILSSPELQDGPMNVGLLESIIADEEAKLDNLVDIGALVGHPKFIADGMIDISDIKNGSFAWQLTDTPVPQFKDGTLTVIWTDEGYATLIPGGAENED